MFEIIDGNSNRSARTTKRDFRVLLNNMHAGQRLAVVLPSGLELAHVLLEAFRRGIVSVPINPRLPQHQIEFVIRHSEAHAVYRRKDGLVETGHHRPTTGLLSTHPVRRGIPKALCLPKRRFCQMLDRLRIGMSSEATIHTRRACRYFIAML